MYIASFDGLSRKSAVALGVVDHLAKHGGKVGVFRPILRRFDGRDHILDLLLSRLPGPTDRQRAIGVTYADVNADPAKAMSTIVDRFYIAAADQDTMVIQGSDFCDGTLAAEFGYNAEIAANLSAPILLVIPAHDRSPGEVRSATISAIAEAESAHAKVFAVIAHCVLGDEQAYCDALSGLGPDIQVYAIPADPLLVAPTVRDQMEQVGGELLFGQDDMLDRESTGIVVGGMTMPHILDRLFDGATLVVPGDREEVLLAAVTAQVSAATPPLAGVILNGGFKLSPQVYQLVEGLDVSLPIITSTDGTMQTAQHLDGLRGRLEITATRKVARALELFETHVDAEALVGQLAGKAGSVVTPLMFEHQLIQRARAADAHIVLPEGNVDRIITAAAELLARKVSRLTLLGDADEISVRARALGHDISGANILSTADPELSELFAAEYAQRRKHKGVNLDQARDTVADPSYFGTMMVLLGLADGMVSGAVNTTAHTIRPALEVVKTVPGTSIVSSVFFMCLADQVLVYGDCAVNPDPSAEQLADIAISSATTAQQFGITPKVAMLSYSTGASGTGADVDKVRAATALVRTRAPELAVEGPIQYDAAVDMAVARTKAPNSAVAGQATVLIFPDLNTGNNTYKAVQRSADAVAIGPVLQGLRKPVNDLSRGALVADIVNTVAITAIQSRI